MGKNCSNLFILENAEIVWNAFEVLLWVKATLVWLKILSNHSVSTTYDLRYASLYLLYRLSYVVRTVRYCVISELGLVLPIPDSSNCTISRCKCVIVLRCILYSKTH